MISKNLCTDWQKINKTSLHEKEDYYSNPNMNEGYYWWRLQAHKRVLKDFGIKN